MTLTVPGGALTLVVTLGYLCFSTLLAAESVRELRVCADPDNLPYSTAQLAGFENKIAAIVASELNAKVTYTWYPQRRGFLRNTLKAGTCDVLINVPANYDPVLTTKPYYSSGYVFVYRRGGGNLHFESFDDAALQRMKIGIQAFGDDGANSPAAHALARRGLIRNLVVYPLSSTPDVPAGAIIDAVASGEIDIAVVWGPFAGYFAGRQIVALAVTPVQPSAKDSLFPFTFEMAMAVRPGDRELKKQLEAVLDHKRHEIRQVLEEYGIPFVESSQVASFSGVPTTTTENKEVKGR